MRTLSFMQMWNLSADTLHSKEYRRKYIEILSKIIKDKEKTICGQLVGEEP